VIAFIGQADVIRKIFEPLGLWGKPAQTGPADQRATGALRRQRRRRRFSYAPGFQLTPGTAGRYGFAVFLADSGRYCMFGLQAGGTQFGR